MIKIRTENGRILRFVMICPDFDQVFYPILNAVRISPDFDQLSLRHLLYSWHKWHTLFVILMDVCNIFLLRITDDYTEEGNAAGGGFALLPIIRCGPLHFISHFIIIRI